MSNYENIKPYAEFSHEAAQNGGVESFLDLIANINYNRGVMDERGSEWWKFLLASIAGVVVYEGAKAVYHGIKNQYMKHKERKEELSLQAAYARIEAM